MGLVVKTIDGREIGRIRNIFETGANDVLVVRGPLGEVLIPAVEAAVGSVDLEAGEVVLTDLAGLIPGEDNPVGGSEDGTD